MRPPGRDIAKAARPLRCLLVFAVAGCAPTGPPASPTADAVVAGVVRVRGKALKEGEVLFQPTSGGGTDVRRAAIAADGTYRVDTAAGDNIATIKGPKIDDDPVLSTNQKLIPVEPGENAVDIDL